MYTADRARGDKCRKVYHHDDVAVDGLCSWLGSISSAAVLVGAELARAVDVSLDVSSGLLDPLVVAAGTFDLLDRPLVLGSRRAPVAESPSVEDVTMLFGISMLSRLQRDCKAFTVSLQRRPTNSTFR
jgi:hypothetical protein